jgi:hypothetical protein
MALRRKQTFASSELTIPCPFFADDIAVGSFTTDGLQQETNQIAKFCKMWGLKCNLKKVIVFKKGVMLQK